MFASMGIATGIDFERLLALRAKVAGWLEGETLHGALWRAGLPKTLAARGHRGHRALRSATRMSTAAARHGLPLDGMRVVEFTHMVMGPTCGMILADLGAEVIKVEPPGGDKTRKLLGLGTGFFRSFNRNKKSVVLDIQTPEGLAAAKELIGAVRRRRSRTSAPARWRSSASTTTLARGRVPAAHLRLAQGLPARPVREARRARRGRADDGRALVHDRPGRPAAARRHARSTTSWAACSARSACSPRCASASAPAAARKCRARCSRTACSCRRSTCSSIAMTGEPPPPMPARDVAWSVYDVFTLADGEQLFIGAVSDKQFQTLCRVLERARARRRPGARDQRAARRGAARAAEAAGRDPAPPRRRRAVAQARGRRPAVCADRAARAARRRPAPEGERRAGADADRGRRHDRRRAAAAHARRPPARRAPAAAAGRRAHRGRSSPRWRSRPA